MKLKYLLLLLTTKLLSQDCYTDINRQAYYNSIEVFVPNSGFEKLKNSTNSLDVFLEVNSKDRLITLHDSINNYDKDYEILWCTILDTALIYWCKDIQKDLKCFLVFSGQRDFYDLTFYYDYKRIIYRIRRRK